MKGLAYRDRMVAVLLVVLAFNYVDRHALGLLLQDIKVSLSLSDTQLGFLTGIAFALFYSLLGIPIARWADRGNRVVIITLTTALWSAAVASCGLATSFAQLLLIRVGVAVGEAGCVPPAHSLIADHFTRAERPRAVARYMLGIPLSLLLGFFAAGWLNELYGWRMTFFLLGLPGVVLALLVRFVLKEPRTQRTKQLESGSQNSGGVSASGAHETGQQPSLREVSAVLWRNRAFRHLLLGYSVSSFLGSGILQWKAAFFVRSYGMQTGELGTWFAVIYGLFGTIGSYYGGEWASRFAANNERLQLKVMGATFASFAIVSVCIYLSPTKYTAFALLSLATLGIYSINGPLFATIQGLVPGRMRAMSVAVLFLFSNLIGMGLGPLAAGVLSDLFRPWAGEESLRYALLILSPGYIWAGWHMWLASRTITQDLADVQRAPAL